MLANQLNIKFTEHSQFQSETNSGYKPKFDIRFVVDSIDRDIWLRTSEYQYHILYLQLMWVLTDVYKLFADNVGSFSFNVS